MSMLPTICSFWHGELSFLERVCIASFVERGHEFVLYAYDDIAAPAGCRVVDAASVVPQSEMFFYKGNRSAAVFADYFRLKLMEREAGIWADCDVYCVKPFAGLGDYVFGVENDASWRTGFRDAINNAVFLCPPDSALLKALLDVFAPGAIPHGMPFWRAAEVRLRRMMGEALPVHHMQFGATGPWPLNHAVRALGLEKCIQPRDVFYPMPYGTAVHLLEPGSSFDGRITDRTLGVHMWHSALTDRGRGVMRQPQVGSFFAREIERLGV